MPAPVPNGVAIACDLAEAAAEMVEARFRRENLTATDVEVTARVRQWWSHRPGAPDGDVIGRRRQLPTRVGPLRTKDDALRRFRDSGRKRS